MNNCCLGEGLSNSHLVNFSKRGLSNRGLSSRGGGYLPDSTVTISPQFEISFKCGLTLYVNKIHSENDILPHHVAELSIKLEFTQKYDSITRSVPSPASRCSENSFAH